MLNFTLTDEQEALLNSWIEKHNKSRKCPINKQRREMSKKGIYPCGGHCQYSVDITFTAIGDLASVKCKCGAEEYLGEV